MSSSFALLMASPGPSGLCAAKTFLECEPNVKLGLLDSVYHQVHFSGTSMQGTDFARVMT